MLNSRNLVSQERNSVIGGKEFSKIWQKCDVGTNVLKVKGNREK